MNNVLKRHGMMHRVLNSSATPAGKDQPNANNGSALAEPESQPA